MSEKTGNKFDLEWAKSGGVYYHLDGIKKMYKMIAVNAQGNIYSVFCEKVTSRYITIPGLFHTNCLAMATPEECKSHGVEYIERPVSRNEVLQEVEDALMYVAKYHAETYGREDESQAMAVIEELKGKKDGK